jgi:hypothetical protein
VEGLDSIPVPDSSAPWFDIWEFALTYNGYDRHGGFDGMAKIGNRAQRDWARRGTLPKGLGMARAALFFEQRRYHHFGTDPEDEDERYVRALLGRIAELGGGVVSGPPDPGP